MIPRIKRFVAGLAEVLDAYGKQESNVRRAAFRSGFNGQDGFTVSLWHSEEGIRQAAYNFGTHRNRIDEDKAGLLTNRTSFTRLRVIRSGGTGMERSSGGIRDTARQFFDNLISRNTI